MSNENFLSLNLQPGGYYTHKSKKDGMYVVWRLLSLTPESWKFLATTDRLDHKPSFEEAKEAKLAVKAYHDIDPRHLLDKEDITLLGHLPLTEEDLGGYLDSLYFDPADNNDEVIREELDKLIDPSHAKIRTVHISRTPTEIVIAPVA